jgi:hypothetical protein
MALKDFILYLERLVKEDPNCLEYKMFMVHGASGVAYELSSPYINEYNGKYPDGDTCELEKGTKYISIYGGN